MLDWAGQAPNLRRAVRTRTIRIVRRRLSGALSGPGGRAVGHA